MDSVKVLHKKIFMTAGVFTFILAMVFLLFFDSSKSLILGLVFGVLISGLNFIDLSNTLQRAVSMSPEKAQSYTVRKYFMRYIMNGVVIFVAVKTPHIHVISTVLGMLLIKFSIMITNLFNDKQFYINIFKRKEV
ncbi:MAG: ATP synthase subunit I [Clostridia bacterium]|nr:ATP synthase subunit I [Clostridia bacterium]